MKRRIYTLLLAAQGLASSVSGQEFFNLDFSLFQAGPTQLVPDVYGFPQPSLPATEALPNWTPRIDILQGTPLPGYDPVLEWVLIDTVTLDGPGVSVFTDQGPDIRVHLASYGVGGGSSGGSISQIGLIPSDTRSIRIDASVAYLDERMPMRVSVGGESVSLLVMSVDQSSVEFGADVEQWAGQTVELLIATEPTHHLFGEPGTPDDGLGQVYGDATLSSIWFSSTAIPEPSTLTLLVSSLLVLGLYRGRHYRQHEYSCHQNARA